MIFQRFPYSTTTWKKLWYKGLREINLSSRVIFFIVDKEMICEFQKLIFKYLQNNGMILNEIPWRLGGYEELATRNDIF